MKKTILQRTLIGIKKGLFTPTLPEKILTFQKNPFIRIFRVLGGLSFIGLLGGSYLKLKGFFLYIAFLLAIMFFIYHIYISIQRYKHIKMLLKSNKLDIYNSPFDKYGTVLGKWILCVKGLCENSGAVSLGLGLRLGVDQVLKDTGRDSFFGPLIGTGINKILPLNSSDQLKWKTEYESAIKNLDNLSGINNTLEGNIKNIQCFKDISEKDRSEILNALRELKNSNNEDLNQSKIKIMDLLNKKD
jgi:hypothetical protein